MCDICPTCCKQVRNCKAIECDACFKWFHFRCTSLSAKQFNCIAVSNDMWLCQQCRIKTFPFSNIDCNDLNELTFNSITTCLCSRYMCTHKINCLPRFSNITNLNTTEYDIESNVTPQVNFKYFTAHDFHSSNITDLSAKDSLSVLHSNIRSLSANHDRLVSMLCELNFPFDLIGLTETKIKKDFDVINNIQIPNYEFISLPTLSNAGGVGIYINNKLNYCVRDDLNSVDSEAESLWIEIDNHKNKNVICGVIYRHPSSNLDAFIDKFLSVVDKASKENKYCILMGDFNINLLNYESNNNTNEFINGLNSLFFQPHIIQPTRITDHSSTLIDNIFLNSAEHFTVSGNILYDITDHLPNFLIINKFSNLPKQFKFSKRDYSCFNESNLLADVQTLSWEEVFSNCSDVSDMFQSLYSNISRIVDKHVPLKHLSRREIKFTHKPWISQGIKTSIKVKNSLFKSFTRTKKDYYYIKFKYYRNKLNHLIKLSKKQYYQTYFSSNINRSKEIWKGIKQLVSLKKSNMNFPSKIKQGNVTLTDKNQIANAFNIYFANIGSKLAQSIPNTNISFEHYLPSSIQESFFIRPTSPMEIQGEIDMLNVNKSTGPFSIPTRLLKSIKTLLSAPLSMLFNLSFSIGIVPNQLKIARVIPIYKKGPNSDIPNYRPISLLPIFSKILEKLMCKRLIKFIDKHKILCDNQFGFRSQHSTVHAVLQICDKIQRAVENGLYSCGIFLDLSKAFDTIDHQILLKKLYNYGIRGVAHDWFTSYLQNRRQFVSLADANSDTLTITCGVPQGSVLGPLLFILYINDFHYASEMFDFHLFADDSNLFVAHKSLPNLQTIINEQLININMWLQANKLSLNVEKTNFVIFHPQQKKPNCTIEISINNKSIKEVNSLKYLGIIIDSNLNWKEHISAISSKISRSIGILSKIRHYLNINTLKQLYYSLIYPHLIYGLIIWGNTYKTNTKALTILQKKALRIMTFSKFDEHTNPIFIHLSILKFPDLITFQTAFFMYQFKNGLLPSGFDDFFTPVSHIHNYNTRLASKSSYHLPSIRTNYGKFNARFFGPKVWNSIDNSIKSMKRSSFKQNLKQSLINQYY